MSFVGRKAELALLARAYSAEGSAMIPIYGRRRIGKSELILQFLKQLPAVYFVGKKAPAGLQQRELLEEAARVLDQPLLTQLRTGSWQEILQAIATAWKGDGKLVIALDEFQWMAGTSPELPSVLQALWDRSWKASGRIMLILCGSLIGFMEREVLGRESPLFGRRTAQIQLRPFGYREAGEFHPRFSIVDRARTYFVCGGVPYYLRFFDDARSIEQNLSSQLLNEHAALFREPDFLLREELRDVENYHAVLTAVAAGNATPKAIAAVAEVESKNLSYYLQQLSELGYVARRYPLDGGPKRARKVRYLLEDPLLRFWFRFVFPHTTYVLHRGARAMLEHHVRPHLDAYFGYGFERLCREALSDLYVSENVAASFEVGEYWSRDAQVDVVGLRDDGFIDLGECKWGRVRSAAAVERELRDRASRFPNPRNATLSLRVFCRNKPASTGDQGVRWHDLRELYGG